MTDSRHSEHHAPERAPIDSEIDVRRAVEVGLWLGGTTIGAHDLLIAATAIAGGDALVTLNQREYARVPGLRLQPIGEFVEHT